MAAPRTLVSGSGERRPCPPTVCGLSRSKQQPSAGPSFHKYLGARHPLVVHLTLLPVPPSSILVISRFEVNPLLVGFGQTVCKAIAPRCHQCQITALCPAYEAAKAAAKGEQAPLFP